MAVVTEAVGDGTGFNFRDLRDVVLLELELGLEAAHPGRTSRIQPRPLREVGLRDGYYTAYSTDEEKLENRPDKFQLRISNCS
ncbi:hypothetical protein OROHE_011547 [Orobanche hederae]